MSVKATAAAHALDESARAAINVTVRALDLGLLSRPVARPADPDPS